MSDEQIELPDVTQDEYTALLDALDHAERDAVTSVGQMRLLNLKKKIIRHYDRVLDDE